MSRQGALGPSWRGLLWLTGRLLLARPGRRGALAAVLAVSAVYILFPAALGLAVYRSQERVIAEGAVLRILARRPLTGEAPPLDPGRLSGIRGVRLAYPWVELGVEAALAPMGEGVRALLESTVSEAGAIRPARLAWGRAPRPGSRAEAVVTAGLLRKLGWAPSSGERPQRLFVRVERTVSGRVEAREVELLLVGILGPGPADRILVPVPLAGELDAFCTPPGAGATRRWGPEPKSATDPWERACLEVAAPADLEPVVRAMESMGYETHHRLAEVATLRNLARLLTWTVVLGSLGAVANAGVMVLVVGWLDVRGSESREIANLRLLGLRARWILGTHGLAAAILGSAAFCVAAGGLAVWLALGPHPALTFGAGPALFEGLSHDPRLGLVLAVALALATGLPVAGTLLPVWWTCRKPLGAALQQEG